MMALCLCLVLLLAVCACSRFFGSTGTSVITVIMMGAYGVTEPFVLEVMGQCRVSGGGFRAVHVVECAVGSRLDFIAQGQRTGVRAAKTGVLVTQSKQMVVVDYDAEAGDQLSPARFTPLRLRLAAEDCAGNLLWLDVRRISSDRIDARLMPDRCVFSTANLAGGEYVGELFSDGALVGTTAITLKRPIGAGDEDLEVNLDFGVPHRTHSSR